MQLQQLRYLIAAAEERSFRAAAQKLYVSQSSVSVAIRDLEQETSVEVFKRTTRGISLTPEGVELVDYARSVIEQADLLEQRYARGNRTARARLNVSSQHYSLVVDAFADFVNAHADATCEFALHESHTTGIIRDVQELRSDLGIIYLSNHNDRVLGRALADADLSFTSLYVAHPHIIVHGDHALASADSVALSDLEDLYRFEQEQGGEGSSFFAEEPLAALPHARRIVVSDNGSLSTLLERTDGYALGTGAFFSDGRFSSVPIETDEIMNVGYIHHKDAQLSAYAEEFLGLLCQRILGFDGPIEVSSVVYERARQVQSDTTLELGV